MEVGDGECRVDSAETFADGLDKGGEFGDVGEGLSVEVEEFADVAHDADRFLRGFHRRNLLNDLGE